MRRPRKLLKAGSDEAGSGLGVSESRRPLSSSSEDSAFVSNSSFLFFFFFPFLGGKGSPTAVWGMFLLLMVALSGDW